MKHFISIVLVLFISAPLMYADPAEIEITLSEMVNSGFIDGDNPFDGPSEGGPIVPPRPTDFRATICGNVLTVTSANSNSTNLVVSNGSGNEVVNTQFVGFSTELLSTSGSYSIEIHTAGLTLIGQFVVQ